MFALDSQQNKAQVQNLIKGTVHGFFVYVFALDSQQSMTQVQNLVKTTLHEFFLKNVKYLKFSKRDLKGQSLDFKKVSWKYIQSGLNNIGNGVPIPYYLIFILVYDIDSTWYLSNYIDLYI